MNATAAIENETLAWAVIAVLIVTLSLGQLVVLRVYRLILLCIDRFDKKKQIGTVESSSTILENFQKTNEESHHKDKSNFRKYVERIPIIKDKCQKIKENHQICDNLLVFFSLISIPVFMLMVFCDHLSIGLYLLKFLLFITCLVKAIFIGRIMFGYHFSLVMQYKFYEERFSANKS